MTTKKPTHMIVTSASQQGGANPLRDQLEKRAARFGVGSATSSNDPATNEKLAARAARFADVNKNVAVATSSGKGSSAAAVAKAALSNAYNPAEADKLAKRAAKFAEILPSDGKVSIAANSRTPNSAVDKDILAKRAARFANNSATKWFISLRRRRKLSTNTHSHTSEQFINTNQKVKKRKLHVT